MGLKRLPRGCPLFLGPIKADAGASWGVRD